MTSQKALFFLYGPAQSRGPDRVLPQETRLTLLKREFGYSRVRIADGQVGYVANEDIASAPEPEPTPTPPPKKGKRSSGSGAAAGIDDPVSYPAVDDSPLPDDPGVPAPRFRY